MVVQLSANNFQHNRHHQISKSIAGIHPHHQHPHHQTPPSGMLVDTGNTSGPIDNSPGSSTTSNADISGGGNGGGANGDAEGVWSPDIDQAFHEALQIYPPCGRRKIILSDEGKMYGRNELIARYIKIRCGKTRTRKQVSSHIQVLARKKQREVHSKVKVQDSKYGNEYECGDEGANLSGEFVLRSGASSPASSSYLDVSAATSSSTASSGGVPNGNSNSASLKKDVLNGIKIELPPAPTRNSGSSLVGGIMNSAEHGITSSSAEKGLSAHMALSPLTAGVPSTSTTAALAAVAATRIVPSNITLNNNINENVSNITTSWPCGMDPAMFNNYYTASVMNDDNIYQQFRAAALAAGVSLATPAVNTTINTTLAMTAAGSNTTLTNVTLPTTIISSTSDFLQQLQLQQQQFQIQQQQQLQYVDEQPTTSVMVTSPLADCMIASSKLVLCGFTAYIEQIGERHVDLVKIPKVSDEPLENIKLEDIQYKYPCVLRELFANGPHDAFFLAKCWANVSFELTDERAALYSVDSFYNSKQNFDISVSTKVCSFGKQVVEKVEVYSPFCGADENARSNRDISALNELFEFRLEKSPMCDYMVRFIAELKKLEAPALMNSVLDNFTVLQIVTNKSNDETLMVIAFIFEVSPEPESTCRMYRLVA